VLSPIRRHWTEGVLDSFPLSWYPMFRGTRPDIESVVYVSGRARDGSLHPIPYTYWASGGFNQGRNQLTAIVHEGKARVEVLCESIAEEVAKEHRAVDSEIVEVAILLGEFDRDRYFGEGIAEPDTLKAFDLCLVPR
jgi:hypothetical protein